jgi:hypothetical protein
MLINTSLSSETAAQNLRNSRAAEPSPVNADTAKQQSGADAALDMLQGRVPLAQESVPGIADASDADQVTEFLRSSLLSQPGIALAAQANANPDSAYNLLI